MRYGWLAGVQSPAMAETRGWYRFKYMLCTYIKKDSLGCGGTAGVREGGIREGGSGGGSGDTGIGVRCTVELDRGLDQSN